MERTLVLIKPDGVKRKLIGKIINHYEEKNLNITALKMVKVTKAMAEAHYIEHKGKDYYDSLIEYLLCGEVCAMIIEGVNVVEMVRKVNGNKDPVKAEMASIRGQFSNDVTQNLVHASDSPEHAEREIGIWFPEKKSK
ncbi:nucleoside-diphosphate kinase [Clostridium oryzae]|uniref:Nucleoside diphosphate kinase n=1 Tax=Clostridium oryzae TaxID=1450648 RepID=A0A1V4IMN0_9CLOT|nr:nucleoside-diphosphate kinase [Clostridium oryzae]OPJ61166.1 nucleoside diphosphate kinase [Clostridium oryzae]